ncbi:MAG: tetratricopeptide repeat protein [Xenococcaceae cyanobacterium MO_188.B19]|nr:tetratricopeptide repeat protein [Xenococcaceae cyanobacterium MO_188.B19]
MKLGSIYLKLILTAMLVLPATASYAQQERIVEYSSNIQARETVSESSLIESGVEKMQLGAWRQARAKFNQALRINPNNSLAHYYRGQVQRQLEQSLEFREAYYQAIHSRGTARLQLGDEEGAVTDFSHVLRNDPKNTLAYVNRGLARLELGETQKAITDFTRAVSLEPNLAMGYYHRGFARYLLGNRDGARRDWDKAAILEEPRYILQLDTEIKERP